MYIVQKPYAYRGRNALRQKGGVRGVLRSVPRPVVVLTAITLIAGLALSGVYAMTKENIDEQKRVAALAAYRVVVPEAETFEADAQVQDALDELSGQVYGSGFGRAYIDEAYTGLDADGNPVGYAVRVTTADGFDGNIVLAVGLDTEGRVNGISFTELNETPGMGMRCDEPEFRDQFNGKAVEAFKLTKAGEAVAEDEIDTVSGASTTSGAVVNAVNAALDFFRTTVKGGN